MRAATRFAAALALLIPAGGAAAGAETERPRLYRSALARGERPPGTATLYRLNTATGELCAFVFVPNGEPEDRGCVAGHPTGAGARWDRYEVHTAPANPGTNRSIAYRLDRETGEVCPFETAHTAGGPLVQLPCRFSREVAP